LQLTPRAFTVLRHLVDHRERLGTNIRIPGDRSRRRDSVGGEVRVNIVSPVVDPECRIAGLSYRRAQEPLTENQRALPVFRKRP